MQAKNGIDFERKIKKMKLKLTKFAVPNGNDQEQIFGVLHKT
jgi:hypothetical protein